MDRESFMPAVSLIGVTLGTAILLYGVLLGGGMHMNVPMAAGGLVALAGMGVLVFHLASLEKEEEEPA